MHLSMSKSDLTEDLLQHERNPSSKREHQAMDKGQFYPKVHEVSQLNRTEIYHAEKEPGRNMLLKIFFSIMLP